MSSPSPLQHDILMSATNINRVSHFWVSHLGLKAENFANPIFTFGLFFFESRKQVWVFFFLYNSCKLQRLLQVAKLLIMYFLTHISIVFLFRHLPTEIVIFINVCYQMKCFIGDSFSFFRSRFCYEQYILDHLSGTKVTIWICSQYDVVFSFSCIASCNLTKSFTFSFKSLLP